MSRKPSFANLRGVAPARPSEAAPALPTEAAASPGQEQGRGPAPRAASREGRKQIAGFFSPEMSLAMHMLALRQGRSLQAMMAEAFDDVLRKHGESPMGG